MTTGAKTSTTGLLKGAAGAWLWDVPAGLLFGDARFADLYGQPAEAAAAGLPTDAFFASIHPDDHMRIRIAVAGVMHGADHFAKEYRLRLEDGAVRWVSAMGRADRDADHRVIAFQGVLADITEQKRVEERLRVAQSAGGVGTFEYVSGFGTVDVSHQFCRLLGLTPTDVLALRAINATLTSGQPLLIGEADGAAGRDEYREFEIVRADSGERRWIARRGERLNDGPGGAERFIGAIHDITPFKSAEAKLLELTATLEERVAERTKERDRVWDNSRDLLVVVDADGVYRAASPAWFRLLGFRPEELVGRPYTEFVEPEDLSASAAVFAEAVKERSLGNFENRHRHKDGGWRWISWQTSTEDGLVYGYGRDVTEEKLRAEALSQTESQLRQAQKMEAVGQLTGGLAHDFNNMLTGIIGGLDLVRRRIAEGRLGDLDRFMDGAVKSAHRAAGLTHRLLAFSRQQSLDPQAVDVRGLIVSMQDLLNRTLGEQVALKVVFADQVWPAVSDVNQLESAILNLAINARDAMPDGGLLTIAARNSIFDTERASGHPEIASGDYVEISVADTGQGMPSDVVAKAFDPFFTTKPIGQGTGLGLSMIYGFVRQIGGHAAIDSEVGKGTTIRMFLPRATPGQLVQESVEPEAASGAGSGETVLVIEDEDSVRALIVEVLSELGYRALEASSSVTALPHLRSDQPIDLVITDVGLPGLNGRQLADMARELRPGLGILFVTGYAPTAAVRADFLAPGMDMISKPFAMNDLAAKIGEMLARSPTA
ncbi:MAG: hybrid sensor histidine kinase/response regulator [Caulobacterales bacterium 68-7]|nr:MAG: hybrid sensor histidine kinase/response regulator [Caulobacterales bacterium 68-7]